MEHEHQISELVDRASGLDRGPAQIACVEEAVRLADAHGDVESAYWCRSQLIEAAQFGGRPDLSILAFSWCLAQFDRDPDAYNPFDLLWKMKWIVNSAVDFPEIPRAQIDELVADMEQRFKSHGSTLYPVHMIRWRISWKMGEIDAAKEAYQRMRRTRRDWLSDCPACVVDHEMDFSFELGRYADGLRKAAPIFEGKLRCATIPHRTCGSLLLPALARKKLDDAIRFHRTGLRLVRRKTEFVSQWGDHLAFLALTGNFRQQIRMLESHLSMALDARDPHARLWFLRHAMLAFQVMHEHSKPEIKLRVSPDFPLESDNGRFASLELANWFESQARALAQRFDARNGNDYCTRQIDGMAKWKRHYAEAPLAGGN